MNNLPDKYVIIIFAVTVVFIFILIFSVKSPEREIIDQPLIWKDELLNTNIKETRSSFLNSYLT